MSQSNNSQAVFINTCIFPLVFTGMTQQHLNCRVNGLFIGGLITAWQYFNEFDNSGYREMILLSKNEAAAATLLPVTEWLSLKLGEREEEEGRKKITHKKVTCLTSISLFFLLLLPTQVSSGST